jgi:hypothetical protein
MARDRHDGENLEKFFHGQQKTRLAAGFSRL